MRYLKKHQLSLSWIAIFAILLNTLMPLVSQAMESNTTQTAKVQAAWHEVCTQDGSVWVRLASDGQVLEKRLQRPSDAPVSQHLQHCAYCVTHAGSFGMAVAEQVKFLPDFLPQQYFSLQLPFVHFYQHGRSLLCAHRLLFPSFKQGLVSIDRYRLLLDFFINSDCSLAAE